MAILRAAAALLAAAALAAQAQGDFLVPPKNLASLRDAVQRAKLYVTEAIRAGLALGAGHGPTDHFFYLRGTDTEAWMQALGLRTPSAAASRGERTGGERID